MKEDSEAAVKENSEAAVKKDSQADVKEDSQADVKENSEAAVMEESQAVVKENSEAAVKENREAAVKKTGEDKNLNGKEAELLLPKNSQKSRPCALGLKRLRRMGRIENYKGSDQDNTECLNPFMQGMPFGEKKPLPR